MGKTGGCAQKGQASILMGLMLLTFILFFAFVVNTGMLVNAKINLQNAADMAAYAGAAVQARQLTHISYLNYEMRRQYKKFLYRYYVVGGMAQKSFEDSKTPHRQWFPDEPKHDFQVPTACFIWEEKDNFCQIGDLPKISIPPKTILDRVNETLRNQLTELEKIRQKNCLAIGKVNQLILGQWLWNTEPDSRNLLSKLNASEQGKVVDIVRGMSFGLGLIPQEVLLKMRIATLTDYLNFEGQRSINLAKANAHSNSADVAPRERTIQAFFSAYRSLGTHAFPADEIVMDELLPIKIAEFSTIRTGFDVYFLNFETKKGVPAGDKFTEQDCEASPTIILVPDKVPLGVVKNPQTLTYYAVRLQSVAKILFSPFGDLKLKAYSAAQPFGSRVGPQFDLVPGTSGLVNASAFVRTAHNPKAFSAAGLAARGYVPNLPLLLDDTLDKGWNQNDVIRAMFNSGFQRTPKSKTIEVSETRLERAYQVGMAPNPWEAGKYNIINDLNTDGFLKYFDDASGRVYALWAPLVSAEREQLGGSASQVLTDVLNDLVKSENLGALGQKQGTMIDDKFKDALIQGMLEYVEKMRKGAAVTKFNETFPQGYNIAQLEDPFMVRGSRTEPFTPIDLPATMLLKDPKLIKSSWNDVKDGDLETPGRNFYSVKYVSFKTLIQKQGTTSNGAEVWTNIPPLDSDDTRLDLGNFIEH